ncbi:gamma-glutamylcyclotransferase family protein [Kitasatospora sp. NPDC085464]|uniref:gamma-glutamylcyclotransferase family protein n=1 Tax=Kitasatospora sp. NPDC085464 TaxID=3364063 RepID=UPI0037C56B4B
MGRKPVGADELVEHWTVLDDEADLAAGKRGGTRVGFALLLGNHARYLASHALRARPPSSAGTALRAGPGFPSAVPTPGRTVVGDLLTVRPAEYPVVRVHLAVTLPDTGDAVDAWVYLAGPAELATRPALIESGDWADGGAR